MAVVGRRGVFPSPPVACRALVVRRDHEQIEVELPVLDVFLRG